MPTMDFTLKTFCALLHSLLNQKYIFQSVGSFLSHTHPKTIILRHDVDLRPYYSLRTAQIEHALGIRGTYFFRSVFKNYNEKIILQIASLGHEIGYHYEDLTTANGNMDKAIDLFAKNLQAFRTDFSVSTACMHGSPRSPWDSKVLWAKYNYKDFGIENEPYFDFNMEDMLYLTDTGRRWNGTAVSVRDKASESRTRAEGEDIFAEWRVKPMYGSLMNMSEKSIRFQSNFNFRSTFEIIAAAEEGELPGKMMMTFHPQRWIDKPLPWMKELVWQNVKNTGKYFLIKIKK